MKKAVIFDLDGVLIDSREFHRQSWYRLAEELGVPISDEFFDATFGRHNSQILPLLLDREVPDEELERLSERKEWLYRQVAKGRIALFSGAKALLDELREQGFALALGSSTPGSNLEFLSTELGLDDRFDVLMGGDDVRFGKPHPEVFSVAATRLGVTLDRCVVIEDAPAGIEAAAAAGMRCVALATTHSAEALRGCRGADLVLESLRDLRPETLIELLDTEGDSPSLEGRPLGR